MQPRAPPVPPPQRKIWSENGRKKNDKKVKPSGKKKSKRQEKWTDRWGKSPNASQYGYRLRQVSGKKYRDENKIENRGQKKKKKRGGSMWNESCELWPAIQDRTLTYWDSNPRP